MIGQTEQVGDELRSLLSAVVSAVEPILGQLNPSDAPAGSCTWCPVCALVALSRGEQHPLLAAVSIHGMALLAILRDVLEEAGQGHGAQHGAAAEPDGPVDPAASAQPTSPAQQPGRGTPAFERISIKVNGAAGGGSSRGSFTSDGAPHNGDGR